MSHTCRAALLKCMDFRLGSAVATYLQTNGLADDADIISVAGAAQDIVQNPEGYVMNQITLSVQLHSINTLYLMHHSDCGAYGGAGKFETKEAEKEMHLSEMNKAVEIINATFPELNVIKLYGEIDENNVVTTIETV